MKLQNAGRRMALQQLELTTRDRVLIYDFESKDRGRLSKLAARWTNLHVLGNQMSTSSWEVIFQSGKMQQVHPDYIQKYG